MVKRSGIWVALIATVVVGVAITGRAETRTTVIKEWPRHPVLSEPEIRDSDIVFYRARIRRDPTGAMDLARLARLYMQRGRETGDYGDVVRAESAARTSLHNRTAHNAAAAQVLAASLLSEHRFSEALDVEHDLLMSDPTRIGYRAAYGEIAFELGRYDEARAAFDSLRSRAGDLSVAPRLARWEEIEGHTAAARHWLRVTRDESLRRPDLPREQVAWIWLRSGDLELRAGQLDVAAVDYQQGLAAHPDDYRVLAAMAHPRGSSARMARGDRRRRALDRVEPRPGDARNIERRVRRAGRQRQRSRIRPGDGGRGVEAAWVVSPGVESVSARPWPAGVRGAGQGTSGAGDATRHYGWDVLAWALYRSGRIGEAESAMTRALAEGTQDAMLFYHAGMIELAAGHCDVARTDLEHALSVNPFFHPTQPDSARAVLRALGN